MSSSWPAIPQTRPSRAATAIVGVPRTDPLPRPRWGRMIESLLPPQNDCPPSEVAVVPRTNIGQAVLGYANC
jgi:hypothetical protein